MSFTDVFNAVVGYYLIVLAVSAAAGVRETLRDPAAASAALAASSGSGSSPTAGASAPSPSARTRFGVLVHGRSLHAAHRFGWATGAGAALGWATGLEVYRAGRRATIAGTARARDWREKRRAAAVDAGLEPDAVAPPTPATPAAPAPATPSTPADPAPGSPGPGPSAPPAAITDAELVDGEPAPPAAEPAPALDPVQAALTARPGRPPLYLVPPPQEYPKIMPAAEIYDMESLVNFTGQVTDATVLESEDAAAASASMIAGAEFAGNTALRVADETTSLEGAVAAMAMLRVDPESTAAYAALMEAGQAYRDITATFSVQCHDAANTAGQMAAAAANYHETAANALAVLNAHQMPHAEAAQATGHSGAHGTFYGVADTGGQDALTGSGAPQLPAS